MSAIKGVSDSTWHSFRKESFALINKHLEMDFEKTHQQQPQQTQSQQPQQLHEHHPRFAPTARPIPTQQVIVLFN